jgi:hypothetical protein
VLGESIVIIDKYETAVEILDKRSGIYSGRYVSVVPHSFLEGYKANTYSRPVFPVLELIPGLGDALVFLPYGNVASTAIMRISQTIHCPSQVTAGMCAS